MPVGRVAVQDTELEVSDWGSGEPVVFVQTALNADELLPLASAPALEDGYRKILYHRRGYAGSGPVDGPGSIPRDAADSRALLAAMGIQRAHIVGSSYSGAIGLQLASDAREYVQSLVLLEPPPVHTPSAPQFRAANDRLLRARRELGLEAALDQFLMHVPDAAAQTQRDIITFFDTDLPALLAWQFGPADARRISCPVLHIGGSDSGPWFAEVRELVRDWLPRAEDVVIDGAGHSMALTHTSRVADALVAFLRRNAIEAPPSPT